MTYPIRCWYVFDTAGESDITTIEDVLDEIESWLLGKMGLLVFDALAVGRPDEAVTPDNCWGIAWDFASRFKQLPGHNLFVMRGAGAFAGSNTASEGGGVAVVGDAFIDAVCGRYPKDMNPDIFPPVAYTRNGQIGAAIHELLHTFGYEHEMGGIMQEWWKWPDVELPPMPGTPAIFLAPKRPWWRRLWVLIARLVGRTQKP